MMGYWQVHTLKFPRSSLFCFDCRFLVKKAWPHIAHTKIFQEIGWSEGNWDLAKKLHERKTKIFSDMIVAGEIPLRTGMNAHAHACGCGKE
jgi:hypothetical protein